MAADRQPPRSGPGKPLSDDAMLESPRAAVTDAELAAAGIRKLAGEHITLYTDLPEKPEIDGLPGLFDQAFPQWCAYFGIDAKRFAAWRVAGCVMKDKQAFVRLGLLPDHLPPFNYAYSHNYQFWVYDQPSDYYRTHLVLHEGTHCFMFTMLGSCGPPWYMEGIAEMLGTHRVVEGRLQLGIMPANREETPMWGRIKLIRDGYAKRRAKSLQNVLDYGPEAHLDVEPYAWCWAAAILLDRHPRYQKRFRDMAQQVRKADFTERFKKAIGSDWDRLCEEWQVFIADLEYGYDIERTALDFTPGKLLEAAGASVKIAADRGWQNAGLRLEAGTTYRLQATGRYQVAQEPQPWWCEPGGVSIRYYRGRPLGMLVAAVRPDKITGATPLIFPMPIGLDSPFTPQQSGTLYLKINDSAAELGDNAGELSVTVRAEN